jgi:TRAP-type transport system periplasmic protein
LAEVYPALERGVVDGVITGPDVANRTKLFEVAGNCTDLMLGPGAGYSMVSDRAWTGLPPDIKTKFEALLPEFRKMSWDLGFEEDKEHLAAVIAKGVKAVVPARAEWVPELRRIAETTVVPAWVQRSGQAGALAFNESIAPIVGFKAKV